jgi:hypothetical protein
LSGFTASINNTTNTGGTGTLIMEEDSGSLTCLSSAAGTVTAANAGTCATINKFGGNTAMVPGVPVTTTLTIKNDGSAPANTFTLTPSACTQSDNGTVNGTNASFCADFDVTITSGATSVFTGTAAALGALTTPIALSTPVAAGASVPFTFTTEVVGTATNADQGLAVSEPLLWSFAS